MNQEEYLAFLQECFKENLAHMRPVENARITFYALYLVLAGSMLSIVLTVDFNAWGKSFLCLMWLNLSLVCFWLLWRWDQVYCGHRQLALRQLDMLTQGIPLYPCDAAPDPFLCGKAAKEKKRHINYFYYLDNEKGWRTQAGKSWQSRIPYFKTAQLFYLFNAWVTFAALALTVMYFCRALRG